MKCEFVKYVILKTSTTMKGGVAGGVGGRKVGPFDFGQDEKMVGMVMLSVIKWGRWLKW